jgi:hypothetical protein
MSFPSIVIYGPQGSGMRTNAQALCRHFGLDFVLDHLEEHPKAETPARGALVLACERPDQTEFSMSYALAEQHLLFLPAGYPL